nr:5887_t:CDS:2 [Entrophospora candida]
MSNKIRKLFPIFTHHKSLVYLDSAGTSLKPKAVIQAISYYYQKCSINSHSQVSSPLFSKVQATIRQAREIIAQKINANAEEIIFLPSTTYSLNILALSLKNYLEKEDKIALTHLEHSSNCYPWQSIAQEKEAKVVFLPLNKELTIDINSLDKYLDQKTKIISFSHMSNSLGVINPVKEITKKIKKIKPNCLVMLDACQSIAHLPINVQEWGIDALVFSGHKVYGPTGIGVLWLKKELGKKLPDFEVGTLPLAQIFGLQKSFEFLNDLGINEISSYEKKLRDYALQGLAKLEGIIIYNQNFPTIDIILFNLTGYHAHDVADYLGKNNICVRAAFKGNPGNESCIENFAYKVGKEKSLKADEVPYFCLTSSLPFQKKSIGEVNYVAPSEVRDNLTDGMAESDLILIAPTKDYEVLQVSKKNEEVEEENHQGNGEGQNKKPDKNNHQCQAVHDKLYD